MRLAWIEQPETRADRRRRRFRAVFSLRGLREIGLTIGAVAGVLCLLSGAAAIAFDIKPVIFRSGSMSPAIGTGALAFARTVDASDLEVGDVVTVASGTGDRVTHRIQDLSVVDGTANLVLRGDANAIADDRVYAVESAPRVLFAIPKAGYVVSFATGPVGVFAGGLLVGVVLLTVARTRGPGGPERAGGGQGARRLYVVASAVAVGVAVTGVGRSTTDTLAYYQDEVTAVSGAFTSTAVAAAPCTVSGTTLTFRIKPVAGATGYTVQIKGVSGVAATIAVGTDGVGTIDGAVLDTGVYVIAAAAVGVGPGVGVSLDLGTFTVIKVLGVTSVKVALCVSIDLDLSLAREAGAPGTDSSARPAPQAPAQDAPAPDAPAPDGSALSSPEPVPEPEPAPEVSPEPAPEPRATQEEGRPAEVPATA